MTADPTLVLAWLVLAHLLADFVLQSAAIVRAKAADGGLAVRGLAVHGFVVGACLVPAGLAFGAAGWALVATVVATHVVVDRLKVVLTRRAERAAVAEAERRHASTAEEEGSLGPSWTPIPAVLFAVDQALHIAVIGVAWFALLASASPTAGFLDLVDRVLASADRSAVHEAVLVAVVLVALVIVNGRAGALFVGTLVGPRGAAVGRRGTASSARAGVAPDGETTTAERGPSAWTLRLGPLSGRLEREADAPAPTPRDGARPSRAASAAEGGHPAAPPARVGEAIGIIERLLIVAFVLTGTTEAIGLVIAAKTLARFRQLDDRDFAEYYLMGTLASVAVAVVSGFIALAVLGPPG
jgi:hypothetical protein